MRKSFLNYTILLGLLAASVQGCKKVDGIDNNSVIETPYSLYFSDSSGALYNTNNGDTVRPMVFGPDGVPGRAICAAGPNLIWIKSNAQVSTNNGINFNPTYTDVYPTTYDQSLVLFANSDNRAYMVSNNTPKGIGVVYNQLQNGHLTQWVVDTNIDKNTITSGSIATITQLQNGTFCGFDIVNHKVYNRQVGAKWEVVTPKGLPFVSFSLSHYNNILLAYDWIQGANGIYYSTDLGANWVQYTGAPGVRILAAYAPGGQTLLIGTDGAGVYRYDNVTKQFIPSNYGLGDTAVVTGITYKENIYKNGLKYNYVYITTNYGLYVSKDLGLDWNLVVKGKFTDCY